MKKNIFLLFLAIIALASFLRLWQLGVVPPSPDWDEVALGYNAHSIFLTGKDEYGKSFPVVLRSFDDYKPALYAYLVIPSYRIFGLNTFAVRLPSALFGIFTVSATFFILRRLFALYGVPIIKKQINPDYFASLVAFLLAVSPWHIQFSRIAFESNVGLSFNVFSILFFVYGLKRPMALLLSALCMALAIYVYQSEKVFTPLLFILLVCIFRSELLKLPKKYLVTAVFVGLLAIIPMVHYIVTNTQSLTRARGVSVFSADHQFLGDYAKRNIVNIEKNDLAGKIFDNRRVLYAKFVIANYLSHFNLYWLFISGDEARHHAPEMGLLYLWELPFLFIGIYTLIFSKVDRRIKYLIFGWFLITPVPAAFTTGVPHAVRTLNFLPTFQIFTAFGLWQFFVWMRSRHLLYKLIFVSGLFGLSVFNFTYYLNQYFVQQNFYHSEAWQYGYEELIQYVKSVEKNYDKVVVSNEPHLDQSYMFFLFYLQYSPNRYQEEAGNASGGFRETHSFGKYEFRPINWDEEPNNNRTLYIGRPKDFEFKAARIIKTINFLENKPAILITEK